jgi:multiple sugar transport system permease protein
MDMSVTEQTTPPPPVPAARPAKQARARGTRGPERIAGWVFVAPALAIIGLFTLYPIVMAIWVSVSDWSGLGSPYTANFIGLENFNQLLFEEGLRRTDFWISIRNNFWYVLFVVPMQTVLSLTLALVVSQRFLKGRQFFRTAFYFPSVTSSIAISVVFLFLFQNSGVVNSLLAVIGIDGPNWFTDARGTVHVFLTNIGIVDPQNPPTWLTDNGFLALPLWEWLAGPSVAFMTVIFLVVWTTAGTFMLMFIAALQDISGDVEEAALVDGTSTWQRFRYVTLPMLKPTLFLVITLGLIGTWQVFDQIYVMGAGEPAKTTLTPAFLSYQVGFRNFDFPSGSAMAFLLFGIIMIFTGIQRFIMRDKDAIAAKRVDKRMRKRRESEANQAAREGVQR